MIDQQLIDEIVNSVIQSLNNKQKVGEPFYTIENVLPESACKKLWNYIQTTDKWETINEGVYTPRKSRQKITWDSDTIVEELHIAFESATKIVNKIFNQNCKQNFIGISLWKDSSGYNMKWHTDNPILSTALQLYLFDTCPPQCGTTFIIDNKHVDLPFLNNTGYILNQNLEQKIIHKPSCTVPVGINRYSLYVSWSLSKKLPN